MSKLEVGTLVNLDIKYKNKEYLGRRYFVKSYNKHERRYLLINITSSIRWETGSTVSVTEKEITAVISRTKPLPDIRCWDTEDVFGFCTYEYNIIKKSMSMFINRTEIYCAYLYTYLELNKYGTKKKLMLFLEDREALGVARLLPTQEKSKSRVVMRRLRRKEYIRNAEGKRKNTKYFTYAELRDSRLVNRPVENSKKNKSKKKVGYGYVVANPFL